MSVGEKCSNSSINIEMKNCVYLTNIHKSTNPKHTKTYKNIQKHTKYYICILYNIL